MSNDIPRYSFNNRTNPQLGFELIPFDRIRAQAGDQSTVPHRLSFHQVLFFTAGSGTHVVDFEEVRFETGSIIPVAEGQVQQYALTAGVDGFALLFTSEFLIKEISNYQYLYDFVIFNHSFQPVVFQNNKEIERLVHMLRIEQENTDAFHQVEYTQNLLKSLLIALEREKRLHSNIACEDSLNLYQLFRSILDKNLSYKLKVADICNELNTTSKRLNAAAKLYTGQSCKEIIDERVVLECKRLLSYSPLSIKEIAYQIGFEDPTNFTKYFKKHTGILPVLFREQ